jgi:hypothetical protein
MGAILVSRLWLYAALNPVIKLITQTEFAMPSLGLIGEQERQSIHRLVVA